MPLDIAILGADGSPSNWVSVDVATHHWMIQRSRPGGLIRRFQDYYGEAQVRSVELDELAGELAAMQNQSTFDPRFRPLLESFAELVAIAKAQELDLHALPD